MCSIICGWLHKTRRQTRGRSMKFHLGTGNSLTFPNHSVPPIQTIQTPHILKGFGTANFGTANNEISCSIPNVFPFSFLFFQVKTGYILVHTCKYFGIPSTNKYILSWHSAALVIPCPVPPCTALYRYLPPCNAVHDPERFLVLNLVLVTSGSAQQLVLPIAKGIANAQCMC